MPFLLCVSVVKKLSAHEKCTRRPTTHDQRPATNDNLSIRQVFRLSRQYLNRVRQHVNYRL